MPNKSKTQKEYTVRKWIGIPVAIFAAWIVYHFVLIGFFAEIGWITKGWAIFVAIIVFLAAFGYWIENSNKSQFYETHRDGMKIAKKR